MALRASLGRRLGLGCASCLTSQPPRLLNPLLGRCYSTRSASSLLDVLIVQPKHARRRTSHLRRHGTTVLTRTPCRSRAVPASGVPYVPVAQGSVRGKPVATVRVPASGMQRHEDYAQDRTEAKDDLAEAIGLVRSLGWRVAGAWTLTVPKRSTRGQKGVKRMGRLFGKGQMALRPTPALPLTPTPTFT
eukprot:scaffold9393_cov66-Phaeocystis_antarctica.AAC.4